jgi:hypothetical protein
VNARNASVEALAAMAQKAGEIRQEPRANRSLGSTKTGLAPEVASI